MMTIIFGLLFFVLIMVSVALHELGHLLPAKLFGVRVPSYFVGFGPTLISRTWKGTEYGIKLYPLGGFVRLVGMYPPAKAGAKNTRLQRIADEARNAEHEDIDFVADNGSLLYQKATWQKVTIMFGGPAMNLLIAFLVFWAIFGTVGSFQATTTVGRVQECVIESGRAEKTCLPTDPSTPAQAAGLKVGDRIVSFNGVPIASYDQLSDLIRRNLAGEARLVVERNGAEISLPTVHTQINKVPDKLDPGKQIEAGWFGVSPTQERVKGGPIETLKQMWLMTKQSVVALTQFPVKVYYAVANWVTGAERDVNGPISIVGASVVAGEVASAENVPISGRVVLFASLLGSVNLFLAIFNLVPLPPLDGGHIAGALYEWFRRSLAKLFGRPDPGFADTAKLLPITYLVGGFLLIAGVALIVVDIFSPISLFR